MKNVLHKANERIDHDLGWLKIDASFRDECPVEDRKQFGSLLILDDAVMIPGGRGFKMHPHDNMEIISWIFSGTDEHNDGQHGIRLLQAEDVQLMSAGTGITHAENNHSATEPVHMFQIWIIPEKKDLEPTYQTKSLKGLDRLNKLLTFISPDGADHSLTINQQAYLSITTLEKDNRIDYQPHRKENGVYVFLLSGQVRVDDTLMQKGDALGIPDYKPFTAEALELSEVIFIEIPMSLT